MNKLSMRSLSAVAALSATLAFAAHAQVNAGVRTGVNANISSDVRANALNTLNGTGSVGTSTDASRVTRNNTDVSTRAGAPVSGDGVQGAVNRTGQRVGGAVGRGIDATKRTAGRALNSVGSVANRADRSIQNALPANARANGQARVQGSGAITGQSNSQ